MGLRDQLHGGGACFQGEGAIKISALFCVAHKEFNFGFMTRLRRVHILALPFFSCEIFGKISSFEVQIPYLRMGIMPGSLSKCSVKISKTMFSSLHKRWHKGVYQYQILLVASSKHWIFYKYLRPFIIFPVFISEASNFISAMLVKGFCNNQIIQRVLNSFECTTTFEAG